jgi:CSLREA domain-containing protein
MGRTLFFPTSLKIVAAAGAAFVLWGLLIALTSSPAQAATYTVNNALDTAEVNDGACTTDFGGCTLREAINAANASSGVADTINFDLNQLDLITLATLSQLPAITDTAGLTIDGSSVNITISGAEQHRVFWVDRGAKLTLNRLTVANGLVPLEGTATAGGIFSEGTLEVSNSTISDNTVSGDGGGIFYDTRTAGSAKIWNTTISDNSVDPDGEGSGIFHGSEVTMWNTIVANNLGSDNCIDTVTDGGNNLDSGISCGFSAANNSQSGTLNPSTGEVTPLDPKLGPLDDNGGPTETHALLAGSTAINKGNNAFALDPNGNPLQFDQRGLGFARIVGPAVDPAVDIGAFEVQGLGEEPPPAGEPEDKQACKKGGYEEFGFKNQGQCIKAVNHAG